MRKLIAVLIGAGTLAVMPAASQASPHWSACTPITKRVSNLVAYNISCQYAGYFSKGFKLGVLYQGSPYKGTYRGFTCSMMTTQNQRFVSCSRKNAKGKQLLRFTERIKSAPTRNN